MDGIIKRTIFGRAVDKAITKPNVSEARKAYRDYFLQGTKSEAYRMSRATERMLVIDAIYSIFPTFLYPFRKRIEDSVSSNASIAFSSAKSMYDNVNRFLQANYLPEEEINKRHQRIEESEKDFTSAVGDEFNLKRIAQVRESGSLDYCLEDLGCLNDMTQSVVAPIRNATEHGHGHAILESEPISGIPDCGVGFKLSNLVSKTMYKHNISGLAFAVCNEAMYRAHRIIEGSLREASI